jgi:dipeptidyl aminopeptidase/acylaminoacyl peptidase
MEKYQMMRIVRVALVIFAISLTISLPAMAQRKQGNPLDHLPKNIEILTHFGERADISPDGQRIAFMDKSFGDAFTIDLKSHIIRCLTCNIPGTAFLRVMHLPTGDYILIGPEHFKDVRTSRREDNELWFLSKEPGSKPERLDQKMSEGAAISKKNMKISYSVTAATDPSLAPQETQLFVADVVVSGNTASLANKKMVYKSTSSDCRIEAQDFFDNDTKMTFTCYQPKGLGAVMTLDLATGKAEDVSKMPGIYNETEGIFPDGKYTLVESSKQVEQLGGQHGSRNIDIWKLKLDGTGKDFERLTHFNDYEGFKASNPVVSPDGHFMAFQVAHPADEAGVGYGILLMHFQ